MKALLAIVVLLTTSPLFSQVVVQGNVTDANGHSPAHGEARIGKYDDDTFMIATACSGDGHFSIKLPASGIYTLRLSAADHEEVTIPLILDKKQKAITVNVQLHANHFIKEPPTILVVGDWNNFNMQAPEKMEQQKTSDGKIIYTLERTATGDTVSYQVIGIVENKIVNGTQADYYCYDGGGDYQSVLRTHKGEKYTITFDPSKVNYTDDEKLPVIRVVNSPSLQRIAEFNRTHAAMKAAALKQLPDGKTLMPPENLRAIREYITTFIEHSKSLHDQNAVLFATIQLSEEIYGDSLSKKYANMILANVPPTTELWIITNYGLSYMTYLADSALSAKYLIDLQKNPARSVRAIAFANCLQKAAEAKDNIKTKKYYDLLKKDYSDSKYAQLFLTRFNPESAVMVGKGIPDFQLNLLDSAATVSNGSMKGKYYLVDFWASWCSPCVAEMKSLHHAYEKFKGKKGFDILSISLDAEQKHVAMFRSKKWKMPWMHAFIPGVYNSDLAKKFEVVGIPKPILVGPEGNIVAMQEDLQGEKLEKTLAKYLE